MSQTDEEDTNGNESLRQSQPSMREDLIESDSEISMNGISRLPLFFKNDNAVRKGSGNSFGPDKLATVDAPGQLSTLVPLKQKSRNKPNLFHQPREKTVDSLNISCEESQAVVG